MNPDTLSSTARSDQVEEWAKLLTGESNRPLSGDNVASDPLATLVRMIIEFDGAVFRWDGRDSSWFFTAVPHDLSADIREVPRPHRGFGSVRVRASIGRSEWTTSIFPDSRRGAYVLPLKKAVRDAEHLVDGGPVTVRLDVLDG